LGAIGSKSADPQAVAWFWQLNLPVVAAQLIRGAVNKQQRPEVSLRCRQELASRSMQPLSVVSAEHQQTTGNRC
jgi:hypothetical protein